MLESTAHAYNLLTTSIIVLRLDPIIYHFSPQRIWDFISPHILDCLALLLRH